MIFLYVKKIRKTFIIASGMAFWLKIWASELIKVVVDYILIKFSLTGAIFGPGPSLGFPFFDKCFLYFAILGPLKACFDRLDR